MLPDIPRSNTYVSQSIMAVLSGWVRKLPEENAELAKSTVICPEAFSWRDLYGFLSCLIAEAEQSTPGHSQRVADLSLRCGVVLGMTPQELRQLYWGGLLHDLGKLALSWDVLHKPGPLSPAEWLLMRQHPMWGYEAVMMILDDPQLAQTVLTHHERWEGGGYPNNLKACEIPLHGRIVAIADTFDALTTTRSYRQAVTKKKALEIIEEERGKQFDPVLVDKLFASDMLKQAQAGEKKPDVG